MPIYELSNKSSDDLTQILDWSFENFGINTTLKYHQSLKNCLQLLAENPNLGMNADYIAQGYFCFHHRSHTIFYQLLNSGIFVVRILNKRMFVSEQFKQ